MPSLLAAALFWIAAVSAVVAQVMILRSTRRTLRVDAGRSAVLEWAFAITPAVALGLLLAFSWRAAMHPPLIEVEFTPRVGEIRT
jgi:hypothetical protein